MESSEGPVAVLDPPTSYRRAERWSLVLASQGIAHRIARSGAGWVLVVDPVDASAATRALSAYVDENPDPGPDAAAGALRPPAPGGRWLGLAFAAAILLFHTALVASGRRGEWIEAGAARSTQILAGVWSRAVTALTLHADAGHVLANAFSGGLFGYWLGRAAGPGFGLMLAVTSGTLGNLANAWLRGPGHGGIGASTAVFGMVGLLAGIRAARVARGYEPARIGGWWLPIAAAVAMLALLGSSEQSDVLAHATGLLSGVLLGAPTGLLREAPGRAAQLAWGAAALALLVGAWWAAGVG